MMIFVRQDEIRRRIGTQELLCYRIVQHYLERVVFLSREVEGPAL
jgi:hypothetical protein